MTDPITPATIDPIHPADLLATLRELDAAATPVPWAADERYCDDGLWAAIGPQHSVGVADEDDGPDGPIHEAAKADAALIAAMRNAIPALLDQLAAQAAEIERGRVAEARLEALVPHATGFGRCEFPPDQHPCEKCGQKSLQLYYRQTGDEADDGEYVCLHCIVEWWADYREECAAIDGRISDARVAELEAEIEALRERVELLGVAGAEWDEDCAGAQARVAELERELAATVKAKQENDERFQVERDEARGRVRELEGLLREARARICCLIALTADQARESEGVVSRLDAALDAQRKGGR